MATAKPNGFIVSANFTDDGASAYRAADRRWSREARAALVLRSQQEADALLAEAKKEERQVCDPYLVKVLATDTGFELLSARERIRATGPTTPLRRADRD